MALDEQAIRGLVWQLDGVPSSAEEAQSELEVCGTEILLPLLDAIQTFDHFGQLCAIELLEGLGDPRATSVLIPLLRSDDDRVREWSASALAALGAEAAVPELRQAYEEVKVRGTPLDWTEPERLRDALTHLGDRDEVTPSRVAALARSDLSFDRCWPVEHLAEVISELAAAGQLVLYFQLWERWRESKSLRDRLLPSASRQRERDSYSWKQAPGWDLDWSLGWPTLVASARDAALDAARLAGRRTTPSPLSPG